MKEAYGPRSHLPQHHKQTNLVSDAPATAAAGHIDRNLRSAWGIAQSSEGPWWVNNQFSGLATVYSGAGAVRPTV